MLISHREIRGEMNEEARRSYDFLYHAAKSGHKTAGEVLEEWEREYIAALLAGELE